MLRFAMGFVTVLGLCFAAGFAWAQQPLPDAFHPGPVLPDYGQVATIEADMTIPEGTVFRVAFDVTKRAEEGDLNRSLVSAARFLNMHAEAGVPVDDIHVALVFHGPSVHDVTTENGKASAALIKALLSKGVDIIVCGQSATAQDVAKKDLQPGVRMVLSAMTAHALLQQQGYTLNPF